MVEEKEKEGRYAFWAFLAGFCGTTLGYIVGEQISERGYVSRIRRLIEDARRPEQDYQRRGDRKDI